MTRPEYCIMIKLCHWAGHEDYLGKQILNSLWQENPTLSRSFAVFSNIRRVAKGGRGRGLPPAQLE